MHLSSDADGAPLHEALLLKHTWHFFSAIIGARSIKGALFRLL